MRPIWQKIDTCPAWNFYKALEENEPRYLIRGIDYEEFPPVLKSHQMQLENCLSELQMQVTQYEIDTVNRNQIIFDLAKKVEVLEAEHFYVNSILNYLQVKGNDKTMGDTLSVMGFGLNPSISLQENITRLRSRNENKLIKINEKKDELNAMTRGDAGKDQAKQPIEKSLVLLENHLKRDIDMKKISVKKWLTMKNQVLEDIKRQQKRK